MKQRTPMKPIPGWIILDRNGNPAYQMWDDTKAAATTCMNRSAGHRVVAVEIRERPKTGLSSKGKRLLNAVTDALCDMEPVPDECPKPRRAAGRKP